MRIASRLVGGLVVGAGIIAASTLSVEPRVTMEVLKGDEARAFLASQNLPLVGGVDRADLKRQSEEVMRARGWWPAGESYTYVRRRIRDASAARRMTERIAGWLVPTVYAGEFYVGSGGYIFAESWNDGDDVTWEGYSEICLDGYMACAGGSSQLHTGDGAVLASWGNVYYQQGFHGWAFCSYSGCLAGSWGCLFAGPAYWGCLGGACVTAAIGCGFTGVANACGEKGPSECNPAQ